MFSNHSFYQQNLLIQPQFVTSLKFSKSVFAFTEQGIAMLSSVLNSRRAIEVNIEIIRVFVKLRQMVLEHRELGRRMEKLEFQVEKQGDQIYSIFDLMTQIQTQSKKNLGFKILDN